MAQFSKVKFQRNNVKSLEDQHRVLWAILYYPKEEALYLKASKIQR